MGVHQNLPVLSIASVLLLPLASIAQWTQTAMPKSQSVLCLVSHGSEIYAGTNEDGVFSSTNGGATWILKNKGLGNLYVGGLAFSDTTMYAATDSGLYVSTNDGDSWTSAGLTDINAAVVHIVALDTSLFAITNDYSSADQYTLRRSTDGGSTWALVGLPPSYASVLSVATDGTILLAGTTSNGIYRSSDEGGTWTRLDSDIFVSAVAVSGDTIAACDSKGVQRSVNSGTTWSSQNTGLPTSFLAYAITIDSSAVFVGTHSTGVYILRHNSDGWSAINDGLQDGGGVTSFAVANGYLYAGTFAGVWRRPLTEMLTGFKSTGAIVPTSFSLSQNYPNPFNPSTVISYTLPQNTLVTLRVYDVLGRVVQTLVDTRQSPGNHWVTFNAAGLPSGVYFCRLEAGSRHQTKKLFFPPEN